MAPIYGRGLWDDLVRGFRAGTNRAFASGGGNYEATNKAAIAESNQGAFGNPSPRQYAFEDTSYLRRPAAPASPPGNGGILSSPITPSPKGEQYMRALDRIAPNVYAPTPDRLVDPLRSNPQPNQSAPRVEGKGMTVKPNARGEIVELQGPMTDVYRDRDGRSAGILGRNTINAYNQGDTMARAGILGKIWSVGGVPVIGSGTRSAAPVDFGGMSGQLRRADQALYDVALREGRLPYTASIDTGIRAGSRGAMEQAAALAGHANQSGIYGRNERDFARAVYTTPDGIRVTGSGQGLFSRDRARMSSRKAGPDAGALEHQRAMELQALRNEGITGQARAQGEVTAANQAAEQAAKQAETQRKEGREDKIRQDDRAYAEQQEAAKRAYAEANRGIRRTKEGVFIGPDNAPLKPDEQRAWSARAATIESLNDPNTIKNLQAWAANKDAYSIRVDRTTGKIAVLSNEKTLLGRNPAWMSDVAGDGNKKYVTPFEYDPYVSGYLATEYGV